MFGCLILEKHPNTRGVGWSLQYPSPADPFGMGVIPTPGGLMAYFPCDLCGIRYRGPSQHLYPALLDRQDTKREHLRLHPQCFLALVDKLEPYRVADELDYVNSRPEDQLCQSCGKPITDSARQCFVTAYPKSEDRCDYWLGFHEACKLPNWLESLFK